MTFVGTAGLASVFVANAMGSPVNWLVWGFIVGSIGGVIEINAIPGTIDSIVQWALDLFRPYLNMFDRALDEDESNNRCGDENEDCILS